ncbi:SGNH hydrolase-type esterase domain-containing protein [Aspergillus navahoensis]
MGRLLFIFLLSVCGLLSLVDRGSAADVCVPSAAGPDLRILPLGASITWGLRSTDGNGYRKALRDQLRYKGFEVNMVGSRANGTMVDNDVEGTSGDTIAMVTEKAANSVGYKPNTIPLAGDRMRNLIMSLVNSEDMANTLIVLSTLLPSLDANTAKYVPTVNEQYRNLVKTLSGEGVNIVLADLNPLEGHPNHGWMSLPGDFHKDGTHPNDEGYRKLAMLWYDAIEKANWNGLIPWPAPVDDLDNKGAGSGEDDGIYHHDSESAVKIMSFWNRDKGAGDISHRIFFARLYVDSVDDIVIWDKLEGKVLYQVWVNSAGGDFSNEAGFSLAGHMDVHDSCNPAGVHWVDINGDGLDDFVCIGLDGNAFASVNNGDGTKSTPPTFKYLGKWKQNEDYPQAQVRVGDVDGDGRADYCVLEKNGDMRCWRNGWINDVPKYWQPLGKRFNGKGMGNLAGVRLEDINGDGRADWLWVDDDGATTTYTNSRSCKRGKEGDGLNIAWRQGFRKGASSGPTHPGLEGQKDPVRGNIHFARVWGSAQDFGLESRKDYVWIKPIAVLQTYYYEFWAFKNVGSGATKIKADGNRYCNMMGHDDGRMDYVWILSKGDMRLYPNKGLSPDEFSKGGQSFWGPNKIIFDPKSVFGKDLDRRDLHLADFDGDGVCDIIWSDPDQNNQLHVWRNRIKEAGDFNWAHQLVNGPRCTEKRGAGFFDRPVHMADITGNGKADYLCDHKDQIKFAEDRDRANLHWADVNGDGRADLIHTNKFNGDGTVWYNRGEKDIGGSSFHWVRVGKAYSGSVAGSCTYYPDLNGDGTADMHSITDSLKNTATTYYNGCGNKDSVGDDGDIEYPDLPLLPDVGTGTGSGGDGDGEGDGIGGGDGGHSGDSDFYFSEFGYAIEMAKEAQKSPSNDGYANTFFSSNVVADMFDSKAKELFGRVASMLSDKSISITCDANAVMCQTADKHVLVGMDGVNKQMNVCPEFLTHSDFAPTADRLDQCDSLDLRRVLRTGAAVIFHEVLHTSYAMSGEQDGGETAKDYAYGYWPSVALARGTFNRGCTEYGELANTAGRPLCGDSSNKEGICDADLSRLNADSWTIVAAALYFGAHCQKTIPRPSDTASGTTCPDYSAEIAFDSWSRLGAQGYAHFGDSYGAGLGTGITSHDACYVGSNSYGNLISRTFRGEDLKYHNWACSGDTTVELDSKISDWIAHPKSTDPDPKDTKLITLSIGGNDVFFSELVKACVFTMGMAVGRPLYSKEGYRTDCENVEAKAITHMKDTGSSGLPARLSAVYKRIMSNAASDAHLYVTGYSGFFNHDTDACDSTTFYPFPVSLIPESVGDLVYLTKGLRRELNNLVDNLNTVIRDTIATVNSDLGSERIHFVDVQSSFDGHRWCEEGVVEPDSTSTGQSWFFLSGWDDVAGNVNGNLVSRDTIESRDYNFLVEQGSLNLPDSDTCDPNGTDLYGSYKCEIAKLVDADPGGELANMVSEANSDLSGLVFDMNNLAPFIPTVIKTFHPRSAGMAAYRDAVFAKMREVEQFPNF